MAESVELAIVGAGPAGLAAASEAVRVGLAPILIDNCPQPGGQYFKQVPAEFGSTPLADIEGRALLQTVSDANVRVLSDTDVWGIFDEEGAGYLLGLYGPPGTPRRLCARKLILAPGAYDRALPFPGWTLPGVMTAGGAQILVKSQRILPGSRILLSGTGPLLWALATNLVEGGATVVAILDANPFPAKAWRHLAAFWGQWSRLREGLGYWRTLTGARVPFYWEHAVVRAEGDGQVERAVVAEVGNEAVREFDVDTICLGYGLVPATQLALQAGCEHIHRADQRHFVPRRDDWLETTRPGLFVAGDGADIGGKDVAMLEGRLAAMTAARQLGRQVAPGDAGSVRNGLAQQRRFAAALDALFPLPPWLWEMATDDTVVCRCEEITVAEVRQAVEDGATTPVAVKNLTRSGMGRCQGRMCSAAITALIERELGAPVAGGGLLRPRPPVLPIPMEGLLAEPTG